MASMTAQTKRNRKILIMLLRSATISMPGSARPPSYHEPARPGLHMRYWRYHSKHVLTNAFDPSGRGRPRGRIADRATRRSDERPVGRNDCGRLLYSIQEGSRKNA